MPSVPASQLLQPSQWMTPLAEVEATDFDFFREALKARTGIKLGDSKMDLVQARLRSRLQVLGLGEFRDYRAVLEKAAPDDPEWQEFINCLTTNKTEWYREPRHFEYLVSSYLPKWREATERTLKVWSAASSTGEEPYSLAAVLHRELGTSAFEVLATDIDTEVLKTAKNGVYHRSKIGPLPGEFPNDFFVEGTAGLEAWIKIRNQIKRHVRFETFNLITANPPEPGSFDLIFCRNVLIYFPKDVIARVVDMLYEAAAPGGQLIISHAESLQSIKTGWTMIRPSIFVKH